MSTRFRSLSRFAILAALLLALVLPQIAAAANTTVTPATPDGWGPTDVRTNATVGITADNARDGLGSLKFTTNTVTNGQDKADFTKTWVTPPMPTRTLANLTGVSYDFYRAASSTTAAHFAPVLRLLFSNDNDTPGNSTDDHVGMLVWEQTYNGINPVPTNAWQAENLFTDFFWMRYVSGPKNVSGCERTIQNFSVTLNDWNTAVQTGQPGDCVAPDLSAGTTYIYGVNTGVGSGWGATFTGYVDNVVVAFGADVVSANFEPNPACTTTCYADTVNGNDANGGASAADAKKTIQAAINQVTAGGTVIVAPGTYAENVTVSKKITLDGAGSGSNPAVDTLIDPVTGRGISITASGASAADRLVIKDLRVTGAPDDGITLDSPNGGSYLTLDNVASVGQTGANSDGIEIKNLNLVTDVEIINANLSGNGLSGFRMGTSTRLDGFTVENTTFDGNQYGVNVFATNPAPTFDHITFTDVTFSNNTAKGIYTERLNNATFTGLTVTGNGSTAGNFLAGIDINLKYANFTNITIEDSTFSNNGLGDNANSGVDLTIKVRNDGSYASSPATLTHLDVNHVVFGGTTDVAMSVGNNLDEATTTIERNAFGGTNTAGLVVFGTPVATAINAECNWWKDATGPSGAGPGSGNAVSPNADYTPWLFTNNLDGTCLAGGTITVVKQTTPDGDTTDFEFDPSWGANFTLSDGESLTSAPLPPATYSVAEVNLVAPWVLENAECTNGNTTAEPDAIPLVAGEAWTCTFENKTPTLCTTVCYADATGGSDTLNGGTGPADAFKTIQKAIDTVQPGGEIRVLPGTYDQDEKNGVDPTTGGAGANNFNTFVNKANITIQGVTDGDVDITTAAGAQASIMPKRAVPTFGVSTMFIQADGVTIQGVKFFAKNGAIQAAKTVEVIGDDVTFDGVAFDVSTGASGVYIGDESYNATTDTSSIADYTITNSHFTSTDQTGMALQVANGAGWPDNVGTRTISDNTFVNLDDVLTFAGPGSAAWRLYPVGTATITGNDFSLIKRRHVMAWGAYPVSTPAVLGYADPDWCGIIANNTFDKGSFLFEGTTNCPTGEPRLWDSGTFYNVAGIYSAIQQYGVGKALSGDLLEVMPGIYPENVTVSVPMTIRGAGQTDNANGTVIDGTSLTGYGIYINSGITQVTIQDLRIEDFAANPSSGIWANGQNDDFTVQNVTVDNNGVAGNSGGGVYMNGPVDDVLIDNVTATGNRTRGIVIWNGFKTDITITNNTVTGNNCCGIELQDGTASGVTVTGNTVSGNADSGMAFTGLTSGAGPNLIANNTLTNNGRFGIEIKLPNGTGLPTGDGSIVVEDNDVSMSAPLADASGRDGAGIGVIRRGWVAGNNNVDIPTGVIVRDNTVSGYQQTSTSEGFGIVVEGLNMTVTGNTLTNNEVGAQVQGGHLPYTPNTNVDGNQANLADQFFGRGNSPVGCALITGNTFTSNSADARKVGTGGWVVAKNVDTAEEFCSIQAAIDDSDTVNGHTIEVYAGVHTENVIVNKSLTLKGANAGISPNDPGDPLLPNPARVAETEMAVTGGGSAFLVRTANVTIDGFKFTDSAVAQANVQTPIIGAGVNFGGDAPGVKIVNNLFHQTNRMVVYFLGPSLMQGGTVDDNRVQDPDRPDTGCVGSPTPPSNCGHQLFNLWNTNNVSFQDNVTIAAPASGDRIRTLNVNNSTNVTIAGNTVRYTCTYTCFTVAAGTANNVTVTNNDLVTDVGNVIQIFSTWTTGNINVNHNTLTTGNDFPIVVDNVTADLDNVHINRNAVTGAGNARNGNDSLTVPGAETLDVSCNWWGSAAEPTNFFGPNDHTPWLFSSDLDGTCALPGTITVVKETNPAGDPSDFEFDPSWGANFTLSDGESATSAALVPGNYSVAEVGPASPWTLQSATCTNGNATADPSAIPLGGGESWTCTFVNVRQLCTDTCYADADNGSDVANGGTTPADAFQTIQKAIDTVDVGGTVRVLPGNYSETASNRFVLGTNGPHVFGLFIAKDGVTVQGVNAADANITDPAATEARVDTNSTANFGPSGIFVEGDGVTIAGLEIGTNSAGQNKTIEIIGDAFTLKDSFVNDPAGSVYFNDWQFDVSGNTSHIQSYTIDNNIFASGISVDLTSGAGLSGPVNGRQITGNKFEMSAGETWPSISFNGSGTGVEWFVQSVGGAIITGNDFTNTGYGAVQWIRARGDYDNTQFNWASYWNDNTYDNAAVFGSNLLTDLGEYSYTSGSYVFNHVRRIGATIQQEVDHAAAGDTVLVNEGTYVEQVTVNKDLTLTGEDGRDVTIVKAPATIPVASDPNSGIVKITGAGVGVEMSGFTVSGPGPTGCGSIGYGIAVRDAAYANIHDNKIVDVRDTGNSGCQNGNAIVVGRMAWSTTGTADITNNIISTYQKTGILVDNTGSSANITGNTISGDGPIAYIAENGIQISRGATAEIDGNTISGHSYTPATATSAAMLIWNTGAVNTDGNTVSENQMGIWVLDTSGTHQKNTITATAAGTGTPGFWGMVVDAPPPGLTPSPVDGEATGPGAAAPNVPVAVQTVVVTGNTFTSDNSGTGVGLATYAAYGAMDIHLTATKNLIHNWAVGVEVYECTGGGCATSTFTNLDINRNSIVGNTAGMSADTVDPAETDGTCNWWGNASGPSGTGPGTGDSVSTEVDFSPWLYSADLDDPCFTGGTITVAKQTTPAGDPADFEFDPSWGANFTLSDGESVTSALLPAGPYSVAEVNLASPWVQLSATCDNTATPAVETVDPSNIALADGDTWQCTFANKYRPLCTAICYADIVNGSDTANGGTSPTDAFKTIQRAIDVVDVGGEVRVLPGTYPESPTVHKSLTMVGVNGRDVTFIALQTGTNYSHSLLISGADVTMDGFTVVGIDAACPTLAATNIYLTSAPDNVVIKNNRIQVGAIGACSTGDDGFGLITEYTASPDVATLTVENNIFEPLTAAGGQRAFYINPSVVNFVFRGNAINGLFSGTAITQAQENLIENNTITGTGASGGLGVWGEPDPTVWGHATIQGNTITGTANAITLYEAQQVTVTKNILNANGRGVRVLTVTPLPFDKATIHINRNAITNNTTEGISNLLTEAGDIDGTCNWWNSASGPGLVGPGSGDKVSAKVDYTPWLFSSDLDGPCFTGGTITIDKVATGAGTLAFEFDVSWSATNIMLTDGGTPYVTAPLPAGQYTIDEVNVPAGWALDSVSCVNMSAAPLTNVPIEHDATITVADGDAWVCTFTNKVLGTIQIDKVAAGGGATAFEFNVSWSNDNVTLTDAQTMAPVALAAGSYNIEEVNQPSGWTLAGATCDNTVTTPVETADPSAITLANGDAWVCTFTNSLLGTVQVTKVAAGGGVTEFEFDVSWSVPNVKLTDGQSTTPVTLPAGTASVSEVNLPAGWSLDNATCLNGQETAPASAIPVENGDAWVCTFTNVKLGTIQIDKAAAGGGATAFEFNVSWSNDNVTLTDAQTMTPVALAAGQYTIEEVNQPTGWTLAGATCDNTVTTPVETADPSAITLANGDAWVCTFTNVKQGTIQITKVAPGAGATVFTFDVSWSGDHVMLTDGQSTTPVALAAGNYNISEINVPPGWTQSNATCVNGAATAQPSAITVANGDVWVCTFTNAQQGTVQIVKMANGGGATEFEFDVSWSGTNVKLTHGQSSTPVVLAAGTASVSEVNLPAGWVLAGSTCVNGAETAPASAIPVENGDIWVCTFTNVKQGTVQITKSAPGGGATEFEFDVSWSGTNVKLAHGQSTTPVSLAAGPASVAEVNLPLYWQLAGSTCVNGAETAPASAIPVENGDTWVCTFNNVYAPSSTCAVGAATTQWTDLLGIGMGSSKKHKASAKIVIPNYTNLVDLYGQLVAKNSGLAKYVRFIQPGKNNYVEVNTITAPAEMAGGNFWYGADLPVSAATKSVTGKWWLQKSGTKGHIPRAFVLYPTYNDPAHTYVNVWDTFTPAEGEVDWNVATGWTPRRTIEVPITAPLGPETFHIELALADNDKDARPVWVTVTAGGVTQTVKPTNPDKGDQLNLLVFDLANVPAGTNKIVIEVYSPSVAIDGIQGDSASLVGMTANYQCSPLTPAP